ncbi:MAG: 4-alpha-glucanotransferase [Treponema sp.]|jgi:4-alpha-glucanotransferase|nr:4-alpha-glucanotransferase [Treponema sp.]
MGKVQEKPGASLRGSAPDSTRRRVGVVAPVGALRGTGNFGVGEFPDLTEFAELCGKMGIGLIQLLPVNDTGYESSPYSALTAFGLHPLYLRLSDLPETAKIPGILDKIKAIGVEFEKELRFPYLRIIQAKMELLREIYAIHEKEIAVKAQAGQSLGAWIDANPWVKAYAVFRRLKETNNEKSWKEWPSHRKVSPRDIDALWNDTKLRSEHLFWAWLQAALDAQFNKAASAIAKAGIILEGDLPILMNEDSCDVWAHNEFFNLDFSAGAPPDMYSPAGQNWGFPIYDWQAQARDDYSWWRNRLQAAGKYYQAYRIDHVLGFFRIWASSRKDNSAALGCYIPYSPITVKDLAALGFDESRIRWASRPHVPSGEIWNALQEIHDQGRIDQEGQRIFNEVLDRIGDEELWLFKDSIKGERDICGLNLHPSAQQYLVRAWQNRIFIEYQKGRFFPAWFGRDSRAYGSLSEAEKEKLEELLEKKRLEAEKIWEREGEKLLSVLIASSPMLPCAEDLGAVPDCVPRVLAKLKILGLRVVRWFRVWDKEQQPYVPFKDYPELSVCTPAVHDSSCLREWWEREADQGQFAAFIGVPSLVPVYNPGVAKAILKQVAAAVSRFRVFQIQDLLHLSPKWYAPDPASERINIPGTASGFNWTYRLPASIKEIARDEKFIRGVQELAQVKPRRAGRANNRKGKKH